MRLQILMLHSCYQSHRNLRHLISRSGISNSETLRPTPPQHTNKKSYIPNQLSTSHHVFHYKKCRHIAKHHYRTQTTKKHLHIHQSSEDYHVRPEARDQAILVARQFISTSDAIPQVSLLSRASASDIAIALWGEASQPCLEIEVVCKHQDTSTIMTSNDCTKDTKE